MAPTTVLARPDAYGDDLRGARFARRRQCWTVSKVKKLRTCGRGCRGEAVTIRVAEGRASAAGLVTCSSIWACPVCSVHIRTARGVEIASAIKAWQARHRYGAVFVTLTLRHHRGQSLRELLDALYSSWKSVQQRRGARAALEDLDLEGFIRSVEVTYGEHGWHPHLHMLMFFRRAVTMRTRDHLQSFLEDAWIAETSKYQVGGLRGIAVDVRRVEDVPNAADRLAGYVTKSEKLHHEVTRGDAKRSRSGGYQSWDLLDAAADGERWAVDLWHEYEDATAGRRAIEWSRGLRGIFDLEPELSDDQLTADALDGDIITILTARSWSEVCQIGADYRVLVAAATDGAGAVDLIVLEARTAAMRRRASRLERHRSRPTSIR